MAAPRRTKTLDPAMQYGAETYMYGNPASHLSAISVDTTTPTGSRVGRLSEGGGGGGGPGGAATMRTQSTRSLGIAPGEQAPPYSFSPLPYGRDHNQNYNQNQNPIPNANQQHHQNQPNGANQFYPYPPGSPDPVGGGGGYGPPSRRPTSDGINELSMSGLRLSDPVGAGAGATGATPGMEASQRHSIGSADGGAPGAGVGVGVGVRRAPSRPDSQASFDFHRRTSMPAEEGGGGLVRDSSGRGGTFGRYPNSATASIHSLDSIGGGGGGGGTMGGPPAAGTYGNGGYDQQAPYGGDIRRQSGPDFMTTGPTLPPIPQAQPLLSDFGAMPGGGGGGLGNGNLYSDDFVGRSGGGNPVYPSTMGHSGGAGPSRVLRAVSSTSSLGLSRQPTTHIGSMKSKRKAIDINKPPFTKEFVDDYRARMKGDPDPEAQFAFAKYLIEAARIIGDDISVKNPRDGRKYRDNLVAESLKNIKRLVIGNDANAEAQYFLANLYGTGQLGLQVDYEKSYQLYMQASKQNHPTATYRTAVCNELGAGTRKEPNRAVLFYRKAAALRDSAAMYKMGMILLNGMLLQPRNPREGITWLRRAAQQADEENPHSLHELAMLYENPTALLGPNQNLLPRDDNVAREYYIQAAQLGYTPSQFKLGTCYEYGTLGCPVDPKRSIAWLSRAAEKGDSEAELALSGWFLTGAEGVLKQNDSEAYLWARKAANKGLAKAEYAVGYYTEVGIGVKQDIELAKRWYMRAAAQQNKQAMQRLTDLKKNGAGKRGDNTRATKGKGMFGFLKE